MIALVAQLEPTTTQTLTFLGGGALWLQILVWALAVFIVALTAYNHRRLVPTRRRVGMILLRTMLAGLLITVFYQPACIEERRTPVKNTIAVVTDVSDSMSLQHQETTRLALVRGFLERHAGWLDGLRDDHDLLFLGFSEGVEDLPDLAAEPGEIDAATKVRGTQSRIINALKTVSERLRNKRVGGVILLSDGIDTTPHGRRASLGLEARTIVRDLDAPIFAVTTAGDPGIKDVSVADVAYSNFAFLLNATSLEATIEVHGYEMGQILVRLTENGREVANDFVTVIPGQDKYTVSFAFVPKTLGKQVFGVEVSPQPDEIYSKNNRRDVIINVIRDKIRVVQIVGQPSWDEQHLRNLLKENPNVDLVSFFIMVNQFNARPLSSRETSLIPFPARELFEEELGGFDLLIFQNFNYGPFQTRQYLPNIAQFVRDGGAFAMIGGPLSLSAGRYYGTPIVDILPITIPPSFGDDVVLDEAPFRPVLTDSGRYHPITRLSLDPANNRTIWRDIAELEGTNFISGLKDDAVVLLEHPSLKMRNGEPLPVASVREVGKGRSMVLTTDSSWHWGFKAGAAGGDPQNYDAFWSNAVRWLIKDPELDLVRVKLLRETVPVGETAQAQVEVFQPDYKPAANLSVGIVVRRRGAADARGQGTEVLRRDDLRTDVDGTLRVEIPVDGPGIFEVEASANVVPTRVTRGVDLFVGTETNPEFERVVGTDRLLLGLAEASGGALLRFDADSNAFALRKPQVIRIKSRHHNELWNAWPMILLIAGLFGLEWWLRRRYGYL